MKQEYFQEHLYSPHNPTFSCPFFPSSVHWCGNAVHLSTLGEKPIFTRPDPTESNCGELKMVTELARVTQTPGTTGATASRAWPPPSRALLESPVGEAASGRKMKAAHSGPVVFHARDKCPVTVADLESFSAQVHALWTKSWQVLGTWDAIPKILSPTFLTLSYHLNLNKQTLMRPKLSSSF